MEAATATAATATASVEVAATTALATATATAVASVHPTTARVKMIRSDGTAGGGDDRVVGSGNGCGEGGYGSGDGFGDGCSIHRHIPDYSEGDDDDP